MGLLGFSDDEVNTIAMSLMSGRGNLIANLGEGLMGVQQGKKRKTAEELQALQLEQAKFQMDQQRQQADQQRRIQALGPQFMQQPQHQIPADQHGPQIQGGMDWGGYANALTGIDPMRGLQMQGTLAQMNAKAEPKREKIAPGETVGTWQGSNFVPAYSAPEREKDWQNPDYIKAQQQIRAAGRPQITTNVIPPQKTFEESLKLKKDFEDQPEVKAFKEIRSAYDQVTTALKSPSAANDLAAATKFMKMLDPGSVVRESELMMAMQASGKLDRVLNYANRIATGQVLTPTQRADFAKSTEALFKAAENRYKPTQTKYQGMAKKYGLDDNFMSDGSGTGWRVVEE